MSDQKINAKYFVRLVAFAFVIFPLLILTSLLMVPWMVIEWAYSDEDESFFWYVHEYWFSMWLETLP